MEKDDFFVKSQIESNITDIKVLLETGVFSAPILRSFQEPVFVSTILKLNDLLQKFQILDQRINFDDDINSGDITDLVNKIRNAICHLNSDENLLDKKARIKFVFNVAIGKVNVIDANGKTAKSDYNDDIAFFYGEHRIYLKRHILRCLNEAEETTQRLYTDSEKSNS